MHCDTTVTQCKHSWVKLHSQNNWLYTCCDVCSVRMICDAQVTSFTISGAGTIVLGQSCLLQRNDATIYSQNYFGSKVKIEANIDVPTSISSPVNEMANQSFHGLQLRTQRENTISEMEEVDKKIIYQREHERFPEIQSHDIHQYVVI